MGSLVMVFSVLEHRCRDAGGTVSLVLVPRASHFRDGADDLPGIDARFADFARLLAPLEV
jgi:hypothetical protein